MDASPSPRQAAAITGLPPADSPEPDPLSLPEAGHTETSAPFAPGPASDALPSPIEPPSAAACGALQSDTGQPPAGLATLAQQIVEHPHLPAALRSALAELVARRGQVAQGTVQLPVTDLVPVLAQALPAFLRRDPARLDVAEHPVGDSFFESLTGELSEAQAERLARAQLAASGLLRGQTARGGT